MKAFLQTVAQDLYEYTDRHMENVTIVFPNKRASLFMNQYISQLADRPVWSPRYTTITELFQSLTHLTIADPIVLNCYLYEVYHRLSASQESFDHFYSWGDVLLSDFNDIDANMVNPKALFSNVSDLEALTSFDFLTEEQEQAIRLFFNSFNVEGKTKLHEIFLGMWNIMPMLYQEFRNSLAADGLAYEGMMKRTVIEEFDESRLDTDTIYAFVGFNILSATERELFLRMMKNANVRFYWDFDETIESDESGMGIRENLRVFGDRSVVIPSEREDTSEGQFTPDISIVASATDNAQCRYVGDWLTRTLSGTVPQNRTAVVLCDESLLQPVLHSISSVLSDGTPIQLNITMGYPMQQTPAAGFLLDLLNLQTRGWKDETTLRFRAVEQLLRHPFTQMMAKDDIERVFRNMLQKNIAYPHTSLFAESKVLSQMFVCRTSVTDILNYMKTMLQMVQQYVGSQADSSPLLVESLFNAWLMVNRLLSIAESGKLPLQRTDTLTRLFRHIIHSKSIPFHGEPAIGVQVMGMLETRNLDFDNIIMLSVGEGTMPHPSHQTSFIPYTLRKAYGLTTTELGDSISAYYFRRLLHRARHITYLYNASTEGLHKGEMSRFLIDMKLRGQASMKTLLPSPAESTDNVPIAIEPDIQAHSTHLSFSPSAINTYIDCPFRYYLQYVCRLSEQEEVSEEIDDSLFGTIFHRAMELLYTPFVGRGDIQRTKIEELSKNEGIVAKAVSEAFRDSNLSADEGGGEALLNYEVICHYVRQQLKADAALCPMTILALERHINLPFGGTGIIDREDIVTSEGKRIHRIVDYKTSLHPQQTEDLQSLFAPDDRRAYHILQTLIYCEACTQTTTDSDTFAPALNYVKSIRPGDTSIVKVGSDFILDYSSQCRSEFLPMINQLVTEMQLPDNQFLPSPSEHRCEYCPFVELCR